MVSNQSSLVTMAFKAIIDGYNNGSTANCQIAIIVITDRQFTSETAAIVASSNTDIQSVYHIGPAKLFVTSLTDDVNGYYDAIAVQLTCNHSGIWNKVLYVCLCVYLLMCMSVCVCLFVCMSVCVYICMCVCLYVCMCVYLYVCMSVCVYVCMSVCLYVCMSICVYVYMCVYLYVCMSACMSVCTVVWEKIHRWIFSCEICSW